MHSERTMVESIKNVVKKSKRDVTITGNDNENVNVIKQILSKHRNNASSRKIIFISRMAKEFFSFSNYETIPAPDFRCVDFSCSTLTSYGKMVVVFQGEERTLNEIFELKAVDIFFSEEPFEYFAENDKITFGQNSPDIPANYISRTLQQISGKEEDLLSFKAEEDSLDQKGVSVIYSDVNNGGRKIFFVV